MTHVYAIQFFSLSNSGELRRDDSCARVDADKLKVRTRVEMSDCNTEKGGKEWVLTKVPH